jgi:hypothetical protein
MRYETTAEKQSRTDAKLRIVQLETELAQAKALNQSLEVIAKAARVDKLKALGVRFVESSSNYAAKWQAPLGAPRTITDLNTLSEDQTAQLFALRDEERTPDLLPLDERAWLEDQGYGPYLLRAKS